MKIQNQAHLISSSSTEYTSVELNDVDKRLLNNFQHDFPSTSTPYAGLAQQLGISEQEVIRSLKRLSKAGLISRIGAVFQPKRIGTSTLAAMAVPTRQLQDVARLVSSYVAVNHNYERKHRYNLWFVVTAADNEQLAGVLGDIEQKSGFPVLSLPMLDDYHIDLGFELQWD